MVRIFIIFILITNLVFCTRSFTQDLEPRRWTPVPLGMQIFGVGYGYAGADI